ncbi:MAG: protein kinase [Candidatus Riflebacteria bacterium]|nr:protein kinase [Candidatus Riflebacteria bacterium]
METWNQTYIIAAVIVVVIGVIVKLLLSRQKQIRDFRREKREMLMRGISGIPAPELIPLALTELGKGDTLLEDPPITQAVINILVRGGQAQSAASFMTKAGTRYSQQPWFMDLEIDLLVAKRAADEKVFQRLQDACRRCPDRLDWKKRVLELAIALNSMTPTVLTLIATFYKESNDNRSLAYLAESYDKKKMFNNVSLPYFQKISEIEPNKARWLYALARCRQNADDPEGAQKALEQLLQIDSGYPGTHELKQLLYNKKNPSPEKPPEVDPPAAAAKVGAAIESREGVSLPPRYRDVTELGRGGMGVVYKAFDDILQRIVAIKALQSDVASQQPDLRERFLSESRILASLDHPSMPKVFDLSVKPPYYLAFEFIEGETLREVIERGNQKGGTDLHAMLAIARDLASGLHYAAERGVLHRDIKPDNILVDGKGKAKLVDFGLAQVEGKMKMTQTGVILGTPWYLAPERLRGEPATIASEIYAFGVTLYEMLTCHRPFQGEDISVIMVQEPTPLRQFRAEIDRSLEVMVLDSLNKNPANRPASFSELETELGRMLAK